MAAKFLTLNSTFNQVFKSCDKQNFSSTAKNMKLLHITEKQCKLHGEIHRKKFGLLIEDLKKAVNAIRSHSEAINTVQKAGALACVDNVINQNQQLQKQYSTPSLNVVHDFTEVDAIHPVRERTFSHWPHDISFREKMVEAGFFSCNVGDRVICIYCNIVCQQWKVHSDDPVEIHKILSPNCPYVKSILRKNILSNSSQIVNGGPSLQAVSINDNNGTGNRNSQLRCGEIVLTAACNVAYVEISKRQASFATWPNELLPCVDSLVKSGFYYTGTKTIVTCFYCNGSLHGWEQNDNPMIEHARWFPHCAYVRQLCGDDLYQKIQESKRECSRANKQKSKVLSIPNINENSNSNNISSNSTMNRTVSVNPQSKILDDSTLLRLVAVRLDLPITQSLLSKNFKLSIIKRCYEDQLRLKHDDFVSSCDLLLACIILQKQIDHINGKIENIIIPSVQMTKIRENAKETENTEPQRISFSMTPPLSASFSSTENADMTSLTKEPCTLTSSMEPSPVIEPETFGRSKVKQQQSQQDQTNTVLNACVICWKDEKRLACIPCGHLATCVPCGHSLRTCPICQRNIEAFVRVYI
ncbi:unnamed protein product [Didymodactylos carnosus]|uniref:RING-type domain-containing protein n=1 Tax=Didymodactylos carnosus TaxID=1234261 RepID=A0A815CI15_9BILA|nr:unnamed protein product [Didymodactylos carnosus]CAF1284503.1 unnamed protein product [Didymodactylos carnosus]CAF4067606.1 unnamed protein product [Didymodactylos carnosus]CAF4083018.1 unnamed protein product [Didymodactylos carnosus]